jgi:hypothetical protein
MNWALTPTRQPSWQAQNEVRMHIPDFVAIIVSIFAMSITVVLSAGMILRRRPLPYAQALLIATVSNLLGKLLVSLLHAPAAVSYSIPTAAFLLLSYYFFRPTVAKLVSYWLFGFVLYLVIHFALSVTLGWTFMFPFWKPRL